MHYEYVSWNRFYRLCGILYQKINDSGDAPDLIIDGRLASSSMKPG